MCMYAKISGRNYFKGGKSVKPMKILNLKFLNKKGAKL